MRNIKLFYFVILNIFLTTSLAFSQVNTSGVNIKLSPSNPKIGDTFTATVESYSLDVDKADIYWILDKKVIKSGFGEKEITLVMGANYENLLVRATSPEGQEFISGLSLLEKSVSIVWEGQDSYIPEWYKGKKYVAKGGIMRAVAVANISDGKGYIDNKDLVFTWEVNGEIQEKVSGLGKSYADLNIIDEYGDSVDVSVTIKPRLTDDSVRETINIRPVDPNVILYEKDNVYGIIKRALNGDIFVNKKELELVAEPFYFSVDSLKLNNMTYLWSINQKTQTGNNYSRVFRFGEKTGSSLVSVYVEHSKKLMQDAKREIKISF